MKTEIDTTGLTPEQIEDLHARAENWRGENVEVAKYIGGSYSNSNLCTLHRRLPFTLTSSINGFTLGPGQCWHRTDGWKREWLPDGWRPLLDGEQIEKDDHIFCGDVGPWESVGTVYPLGTRTRDGRFFARLRTRRPLPPVETLRDKITKASSLMEFRDLLLEAMPELGKDAK